MMLNQTLSMRGPERAGHRAYLVAGLAAAALLLAPTAIYPIFLMKVMSFALFAAAFNLLMGYTGLLSFGHAAFFGGSAYVAAYMAKTWGLPAELAILGGTATGAFLGLVFGWVGIRKQGIYFGMITMAMAQIVFFIAVQAPFTGGEDGIQGVPRWSLIPGLDLSRDLPMYFFTAAVALVGLAIVYRTVNSPFGEILRSIRENEVRAESLGYNVERFKLIAFTLSAALSGMAGSLKAIAVQLATLSDVEFFMSGEVVLMVLIGGLGTMTGPLIGAAIVITMQHYLASFGIWVKTIQGAIFVLCVLAFRRGIVGEIVAWQERRRAG
jgi:branched-chain amino acid transport system permease protein